MNWAVASRFEAGLRYWTGDSHHVPNVSFEPIVTGDRQVAAKWSECADARAIALHLTESCSDLAPFAARTWFAIALPECRQ